MGRVTSGNASQVRTQDKNLQALAVKVSIGFSATLWFIVLFTPAPRRHYIPLCLLENHYGAIKSNVVSQTNMTSTLCLTAGHFLEPLVTTCPCDGQETQLSRKHSTDGSGSGCITLPGSLSDIRAVDLHQRWCANDSFQVTVVWNVQ